MNERTCVFIKNLSHFILERAMVVVCERWAGDGDRLLYWPSSTSISSWLGVSTVGHWEAKALCLPLALNSASCLQLTGFFKSPNSQPIASGHDVIHTPVSFLIWGLLWQLWLSYPLCASVNCTQCLHTWTKSRIVQSPTKLNDKI